MPLTNTSPALWSQGQFCSEAGVLRSTPPSNTPSLSLWRARYGDFLIQSLAPLSSCGELPYSCPLLSTSNRKGGLGQAPDRESWPGCPAGMPGSLCAVAVCLAPVYAKGMEVVAPPASQRPAGSKTEGKQRGCLGTRWVLVCQLGGQSSRVSGTLSCSFPSKLGFLDSTVGCFVHLWEARPGAPDACAQEQRGQARKDKEELDSTYQPAWVRLWLSVPNRAVGLCWGPRGK